MATVSPSPDSVPSGVPPPTSLSPPQPSTPPQSQPSTPSQSQPSTPPQSQPSTPPQSTPSTPPSQPAASPPVVAQPNANPPDPSTTPPPIVPPPTNAGPPPVTPPPVNTSPPPSTPNAPPPSSPAAPPPIPPTASPPPVSTPPPTQTTPPVSSPPPAVVPPPSTPTNPPSTPANPPTNPPSPPANPPISPPSPPGSATPPPTSVPPPFTPPPTNTPTPPSANPPSNPPPSLPSPSPPGESPPPPTSTPPESSPPPTPASPGNPSSPPSPPSSEPPQSSPSPPAASPPTGISPPSSGGSPPPSDRPQPASPPSLIPGPPTPGSHNTPPSPGAETVVPSPPSLPGDRPSGNSPDTANDSSGHGGIGSGATIAIAVVAGLLILGLLGLIGLWIFKRKKRSSGPYNGHVIPASIGSSPRSDGKLLVKTEYPGSSLNFGGGSGTATPSDGGFGHSRSWFTYQELYEATSGFSDEKLLGEGGFGRVYKGLLADGRVIAVKQLKVGGGQGEREFKAEVEIISRIHHRHLVSLVGYCILENKRLLVYDYVPNDTLHFHLHGNGRPVMDWTTRVKIAIGAARGITYLHEDCHPRIIHRDIKSSNILLDNNFEAQVSDFGLAKLAMDADTHVSTRVMGTFGYMAPEYATSGKLTEKSDVFSYGVVLLELITGRKPVDESQPLGDESLVEWARPLLTHALDTGELDGLVDARLENNYIESEMLRMIEAAAACVRHSAVKRPKMGLVLRALGMSDSGDLSNGLRVGESQLYDSAQQSAEIRWFRRMAFGSQNISTDFFSSPSHNIGFSGQSRQNAALSTQHDQPNSQNMGLRNQSGDNLNFLGEHHSTKHNTGRWNQSGNNTNLPAERQSTHHNLGLRNQSGNNLNFSAERHSNQHNPGLWNQGGNNQNFPAERHSTQHNMGPRNQSGNNLNVLVERQLAQQRPDTINHSFQRQDSGNL